MCFTANKRQTSEACFFFLCRGISCSDRLSGNVHAGVENVSRPSKTLLENIADNSNSFSF